MTTWAVSFLMIVPIFLYAHTQPLNTTPDWPVGMNSSTLLDAIYWPNGTSPPISAWVMNQTVTSAAVAANAAAIANSYVVSCNIYWPENEYMNGQAAFTLYTFTLAFAIPLVLILVFYILVIRKLQVIILNIYF